jgi:ribose/xylose/arabinose/galactoside ABC-type transport system permease subunit
MIFCWLMALCMQVILGVFYHITSLDSIVVTLHLDFVVKGTTNFVKTLLSGSGPSTL